MESGEFFELVRGFFGPRNTQEGVSYSTKVFTCTLYESFKVSFGLDGEHGEFTGGIEFAPGRYFTNFFGKRLSPNSDRESILANLAAVDEWCRLRLPDKFLERYDAAMVRKSKTALEQGLSFVGDE